MNNRPRPTDAKIRATARLSRERLRTGKRIIGGIFRRFIPSGTVILPAALADALRKSFTDTGLYRFAERYAVTRLPDELITLDDFQGGTEVSVRLPPAVAVKLANALGMPKVELTWHGDCTTCIFGPDRGWSAPCVSCGTGHPCHTPIPRTRTKS